MKTDWFGLAKTICYPLRSEEQSMSIDDITALAKSIDDITALAKSIDDITALAKSIQELAKITRDILLRMEQIEKQVLELKTKSGKPEMRIEI